MKLSKKSRIYKIILCTILALVLVIIGFIVFLSYSIRPVPKHKRNLSEANAKIEVDINDTAIFRTPIIRTYKEEDYNKFDENKIKKIMKTVAGNIEGDIPAIELKDDKDIMYISFIKDGKEILPDQIPDIRILIPKENSAFVPYDSESNKIIKDKLKYEEKRYSYKLKRYRTQYEKYFLDYNIIEIIYELDGEKYISVFGINTTNIGDGESFFENEMLEEPKEPEI